MDSCEIFDQFQQAASSSHYGELERNLRKIIADDQKRGDAWYYLGIVQVRENRFGDAIHSFQEALACGANPDEILGQLSFCYLKNEDFPAAIDFAKKTIGLQPLRKEAWINLGCAQIGLKQFEDAIETSKQAVALFPDSTDVWLNLGAAQYNACDIGQAALSFQKGLKLSPDHPELLFSLGMALTKKGRYSAAIPLFKQLIFQNKNHENAYVNLAFVFFCLKQYGKAEKVNALALALNPHNAMAKRTQAHLLLKFQNYEESIKAYKELLEKNPFDAEFIINLAICYTSILEVEKAIELYQYNLTVNPHFVDTYWMMGMAFLIMGDFKSGFTYYEARLKSPKHLSQRRLAKQVLSPSWNGEDLLGKKLFVMCEQGFGDIIQLLRYIPLLKKMTSGLILQLPESLHCFGKHLGCQVIRVGSFIPKHDFHVYLMSLPYFFKTDIDTIPPPFHIPRNCSSIPNRIGIVWKGNPDHKRDRDRSIALESFKEIFSVSGKQYLSLQKETSKEEKKILDRYGVYRPELPSFSYTASLISSCELVISVDTVVAHLAGSMGVATWVLINYFPDWRWMLGRADSPWYPSLRLFRQDKTRRWEKPLKEIVNHLKN